MSSADSAPPLVEVLSVDNFFIFVRKENSLWWDKRTGKFYAKPGGVVPDGVGKQCLGTCFGIIGKLELPGVQDPKILLVRQYSDVGHGVFKIKNISFLQPTSPEIQPSLNACPSHRLSQRIITESGEQKSAFAKTLGAMKTASNTIKSSTQQAAAKIISKENKLERRMLEELSKVFNDTDSFYFSFKSDLTNSLQRQSRIKKDGTPSWKTVDDRFFWNKFMLNDIMCLEAPLCDPWVIPVIQGFVQTEVCKINVPFDDEVADFSSPEFKEVEVTLISRRSRHRAGTRYKRRGVDENGHVANYVETEQILKYDHHITSFVQIRGSVPVFWSQPGYKYRPPPTLLKGPVETQTVFNKHFAQELETYGPVCVVNLVEQGGKERVIWDAYTNHILSFNNSDVTYCTFDFHEYCRGMHFENVSYLSFALSELLRTMGYFWSDRQGGICDQNGVFRVNCIDCLDRTNVVQTSLGKVVLERQLTKLGLLPPEGHLPTQMRVAFQLLWANNGDIISRQYAGTNALKGDYTRTGERKLTGLMKDGMNSANRYTRVHLRDGYRQAAIDIMQGITPEPIDTLNEVAATTLEVVSTATSILPDQPEPTSIRHVACASEAQLCYLLALASRYYLSRFKDAYRQATIDIMLGDEVSEDVFADNKGIDDEDSAATAERVKLLLDDCKKLLINEPTEVLGCWGLIDADPVTGDPSETEMDTILILTKFAYYIAEYDEQVDRVSKYQRVALREISLLQVGISGVSAPLSMFKKQDAPHCIRIHYLVESESGYFHTFRSTGLRFFNNVAVQINTAEEMLESLKAICETFLVALEVANLPPIPVIYGKPLERLKSKPVPSDCFCRLGSYLDLGSNQGMTRNASETQLANLRTAGSKALSNISQQFSKMGRLGQSFRRNPNRPQQLLPSAQEVKPPVFSIEPVEDTETSPTSSQTSTSSDEKPPESLRNRHWYLSSAGLLMSDTPSRCITEQRAILEPKSPLIHAKTQGAFDPATLSASIKKAQEKGKEIEKLHLSHSDSSKKLSTSTGSMEPKIDFIEVPSSLNLGKRCSSEKNLTLNLASSQSESALRSIRSNFTNALSTPASTTKEMLSPLTKFAKGVHSLGANLDPRKLKGDHSYHTSEAHVEEIKRLKDRWAGCETKLIAL